MKNILSSMQKRGERAPDLKHAVWHIFPFQIRTISTNNMLHNHLQTATTLKGALIEKDCCAQTTSTLLIRA